MEYIQGMDISYYQGAPPLNLSRAASRGIDYVCIRKSIGAFNDTRFQGNWQMAPMITYRTLYHAFLPWVDWRPQAQILESGIDVNSINCPTWLDVEKPHYLSNKLVMGRLMGMLKFMQDLTGMNVAIYTSKYAWETYYSRKEGWGVDWPLVVANYSSGMPAIPIGWTDWDGWQYSADGNKLGPFYGVKSASIDLDLIKPGRLIGK